MAEVGNQGQGRIPLLSSVGRKAKELWDKRPQYTEPKTSGQLAEEERIRRIREKEQFRARQMAKAEELKRLRLLREARKKMETQLHQHVSAVQTSTGK